MEDGDLMAIGVETLRSSGMLPFDLYFYGDGPTRPILYREKTLPVGDDDLARLLERAAYGRSISCKANRHRIASISARLCWPIRTFRPSSAIKCSARRPAPCSARRCTRATTRRPSA